MAAERTAQRLGQVYRESQQGAAYAKSVIQAFPAPATAWRALASNSDRPAIAASAGAPANAIVGRVAPNGIAAAIRPGKSLANRATYLRDDEGLALLENSVRQSFDAGRAAHINPIVALLERAAAPRRPGEP